MTPKHIPKVLIIFFMFSIFMVILLSLLLIEKVKEGNKIYHTNKEMCELFCFNHNKFFNYVSKDINSEYYDCYCINDKYNKEEFVMAKGFSNET